MMLGCVLGLVVGLAVGMAGGSLAMFFYCARVVQPWAVKGLIDDGYLVQGPAAYREAERLKGDV